MPVVGEEKNIRAGENSVSPTDQALVAQTAMILGVRFKSSNCVEGRGAMVVHRFVERGVKELVLCARSTFFV